MPQIVALGSVASIWQGLGLSGRSAGARAGDWLVKTVGVSAIQDDRLQPEEAQCVAIEQNLRTERHLLLPDDLLVTARSSVFKAALVPMSAGRLLADASLNVIRPAAPGLASCLWWYMTSAEGRRRMQELMFGVTVRALSAASVRGLELPIPDGRELLRIAELIDVSERAYAAAVTAAELRRKVFRDGYFERLRRESEAIGAKR